jgi:hypothetical protein
MQKKLCLALMLVAALGIKAIPASAWVFTPDETGWQTYSYTAGSSGFIGSAGFVVSCQGGLVLNSYLLLDNLSKCGQAGNESFETKNYDGYTLVNLPVGQGISYGFVLTGPIDGYNPTAGTYMSAQISQSENTSGFLNAFGNPGTQGSLLETAISLTVGQSFTFDWAFLAGNFEDFSLFYLKDSTGTIIFQDGLGQQVPVPIPTAALLFGSGLMGLVSWRRFRKS